MVRALQRSFSRTLQSRIVAHGVNLGHWPFLRVLWEEDGLTQRELSQRAGMMEPTTVAALNVLEQRSLVTRVRNSHDRRKMNVYLTAKGRALHKILLDGTGDVVCQAFRGIGPVDITCALGVLVRMRANLDESGQGPADFDKSGPEPAGGSGEAPLL
jgi:DNA-binding MarR family transcriptional regulator